MLAVLLHQSIVDESSVMVMSAAPLVSVRDKGMTDRRWPSLRTHVRTGLQHLTLAFSDAASQQEEGKSEVSQGWQQID